MFPRRMTFHSKVSQHLTVWHSKLVFAKVTGVIHNCNVCNHCISVSRVFSWENYGQLLISTLKTFILLFS